LERVGETLRPEEEQVLEEIKEETEPNVQ